MLGGWQTERTQRRSEKDQRGEEQGFLASEAAAQRAGQHAADHAADDDAAYRPSLGDFAEVENPGARDVFDHSGDHRGIEAKQESAG